MKRSPLGPGQTVKEGRLLHAKSGTKTVNPLYELSERRVSSIDLDAPAGTVGDRVRTRSSVSRDFKHATMSTSEQALDSQNKGYLNEVEQLCLRYG